MNLFLSQLWCEKFAVYMDTGQTETIFAELVTDRSDSIFMIIGHDDKRDFYDAETNGDDDDNMVIIIVVTS